MDSISQHENVSTMDDNDIINQENKDLRLIFDILVNIFKDRKRRISFLYTLYSCFLLFSPILIALDRFISISGTLLTGVPFVLGMLLIFHNRKQLLKYIVIILLFLISVIINRDFGNGFETFKPLMIFLFSVDLCANKKFLNALKRCFKSLKKEILIMLSIIVFLNLIMTMFSLGYSNIDTETWGLDAYMGLYSSPHQAAYRFSCLLVFIVYMYIIGYKKILSVILIAITSFLLLKTGARTPTAIGIFIVLFLIYMNKKQLFIVSKKYIIKYKKAAKIVLPILAIIIIVLLFNSAFVQKMINLSSQTFDSGRAMLRNQELSHFGKSKIVNMLFGNSLDVVYTVNHLAIGARIWCHNDFMQILMQFGSFMLIAYLYSCINFIILQIKLMNSVKVKILFLILVALFMFVSFYNGLFFFPRFTIVIPLLYILMKDSILEVRK